ncbi:cytochrome b/b6 domain-containing protein [Algibacillus agarilyticus]|uniref:cytochrome b/b6 domain-containing protein n=1 Tax=Algibacillus agarilyticus TaxID=2234133 RepID=UPI000DCFED2A|nr:cytochrome b/b6 domain-containing protein [Algibacillus agarilyticus]
MKTLKIWDSATRIFHWALVINIVAAWYTIENRLIELHEIAGHCLIGLLVFRLIWAILGSRTSRFTHFVVQPFAALRYLNKSIRLQAHHQVGHNPAGGWMVIVMMCVLGFQVFSGLLSNDDLGFSGALSDHVSKALSDTFTQLHRYSFNALVTLIWLHLVAVFFYVLIKKDNLIKAMFTGKKTVEQAPVKPLYFAPTSLALLCGLIAGAFSYWLF